MAGTVPAVGGRRARGSDPSVAPARAPAPAPAQGSGSPDAAVVAGRYELCARLGHGASGSVYRAHDRVAGREVAVKLLTPGLVELAAHEADILARLDHPNIVALLDHGHADGQRFLVLELIDGVDLSAWQRATQPPPAALVRAYLAAGRGLAAAHRCGVVHRDFKPSNALRTHAGRVVVVDFGLATTLVRGPWAGERQAAGASEGTLAYMAPEQLAGREADERSDQFGFCVALWEALAGRPPFAGADPLARYAAIRAGLALPASPSSVLGPPGLAEAIARGLAFAPDQRFASLELLLTELERPLAPTGPQAPAPGDGPLRRAARRLWQRMR